MPRLTRVESPFPPGRKNVAINQLTVEMNSGVTPSGEHCCVATRADCELSGCFRRPAPQHLSKCLGRLHAVFRYTPRGVVVDNLVSRESTEPQQSTPITPAFSRILREQ